MKTYARIQSGLIAELLTTSGDPATLFSPLLHWQDVTGQHVQVGWIQGDTGFTAPPPPTAVPIAPPTIAQLQAELALLTQQIAALSQI